jgi:hypothetical protein
MEHMHDEWGEKGKRYRWVFKYEYCFNSHGERLGCMISVQCSVRYLCIRSDLDSGQCTVRSFGSTGDVEAR